MTQTNPYRPTQAAVLDVDDEVLLPSGWKRAWMSLAFSYTACIPMIVGAAIANFGLDEGFNPISTPLAVLFFGSIVILPSWFVVFLPLVLLADPRAVWLQARWLSLFGVIVGFGWAVPVITDNQPDFGVALVLILCGAPPGFLYGRWNRRFLQRKSHA